MDGWLAVAQYVSGRFNDEHMAEQALRLRDCSGGLGAFRTERQPEMKEGRMGGGSWETCTGDPESMWVGELGFLPKLVKLTRRHWLRRCLR